MTERAKNVVQWVYSAQDERQLAERYDEWAKTYDQDLDAEFGWIGPALAVERAVKYVPKAARILDAGAGTGLVGQLLASRGYTRLAAMDISAGMLEEARNKAVYEEFHQMTMGQPLGFPTASFDAVISVGAFTVGHAPASSMDELVRITKPRGHVIFGLRPDVYEESGFKDKLAELETRRRWKRLEVTEPVQVLPKGEPDVYHQVWVYEVLDE